VLKKSGMIPDSRRSSSTVALLCNLNTMYPQQKMKTKTTNLPKTSVNPPNQPNATRVRQNIKTRSATILATIVTSLVALTSASDALAQGTWTTIARMLTGVQFASGVASGGKFYVIDGSNGGWPGPSPQVYDPIANNWSFKAADPVTRAETAVAAINNKIYVAEGWIQSDSNNPTTALEIYDPATDSWTAGAPSVVARGLSATAVIGGKIYITDGYSGFYQNPGGIATLEIYDTNTNTWSTGAPIPVATSGAVGAALNGKFYVVGGGGLSGIYPAIANVYIYDPTTDTWTSGAAMPSPRDVATGGVINGKLYITGGYSSLSLPSATDNPVVVYDPITGTWSTGAAEPTPRGAAAAAAVGGTLFVAGGLDQNNSNAITSTAEAFTPVIYSAQVQQPINPDGSSVFCVKRGVVPVKFTLTLNGVATCDLPPATISIIRTAGGVLGSIDENTYLSSADSGSNFRIDSTNCQYVYNLATSSLGVGEYTVSILIGGSVVGSGTFGLK
jgi:N-acetylneuraminic acid mutarotase